MSLVGFLFLLMAALTLQKKTNFGSNYLAIGCSLKNSRLFVWGRTLDKKNAIVYMSKNLGESWETIFENEGIVITE